MKILRLLLLFSILIVSTTSVLARGPFDMFNDIFDIEVKIPHPGYSSESVNLWLAVGVGLILYWIFISLLGSTETLDRIFSDPKAKKGISFGLTLTAIFAAPFIEWIAFLFTLAYAGFGIVSVIVIIGLVILSLTTFMKFYSNTGVGKAAVKAAKKATKSLAKKQKKAQKEEQDAQQKEQEAVEAKQEAVEAEQKATQTNDPKDKKEAEKAEEKVEKTEKEAKKAEEKSEKAKEQVDKIAVKIEKKEIKLLKQSNKNEEKEDRLLDDAINVTYKVLDNIDQNRLNPDEYQIMVKSLEKQQTTINKHLEKYLKKLLEKEVIIQSGLTTIREISKTHPEDQNALRIQYNNLYKELQYFRNYEKSTNIITRQLSLIANDLKQLDPENSVSATISAADYAKRKKDIIQGVVEHFRKIREYIKIIENKIRKTNIEFSKILKENVKEDKK